MGSGLTHAISEIRQYIYIHTSESVLQAVLAPTLSLLFLRQCACTAARSPQPGAHIAHWTLHNARVASEERKRRVDLALLPPATASLEVSDDEPRERSRVKLKSAGRRPPASHERTAVNYFKSFITRLR